MASKKKSVLERFQLKNSYLDGKSFLKEKIKNETHTQKILFSDVGQSTEVITENVNVAGGSFQIGNSENMCS